MFEIALEQENVERAASIKVIGVGGAGGNTVNSMIDADAQGIEFIVANTDAQALRMSKASVKIQIGVKLTKGLGSGAHPDIGRRAAEEDLERILESVEDADIVFLAAGMGGGTGSGALPIIARALKDRGILSIATVTRPFLFEGKHRARIAQEAINLLAQEVDTLVVVANQKLLETVDASVSMIDAFAMINNVLYQSVKSIADIIINPGHINVDFADLRTIMKDMGLAVMGTGHACGSQRAQEAALQAIASPLLENMSIAGARGILLNITGGIDLGLHEINEAASIIREQAAEDANIIIGSVIDQNLQDEVKITVIATGFQQHSTTKQVSTPELLVKATTKDRSIEKTPPIEHTQVPVEIQNTTKVSPLETPKYSSMESTIVIPREEPMGTSEILDDFDVPAFMRKEELGNR